MADFTSFTARQLQHVASKAVVKTEGMLHRVLPLCQVDDESNGFTGVTYELEHPLRNMPEDGSANRLAYGEHPLPEGDGETATITLRAHRVASRVGKLPRGFNNDERRLQRLEILGPVKMGEAMGNVERDACRFIFNTDTGRTEAAAPAANSSITIVDAVPAGQTLEDLDPAQNIFANIRNAMRAKHYYRYRSILGASLEAFILREDLSIIGEFLEITGILGREDGAATVRLNPGGMTEESIARAIMARFDLDAVHIGNHFPSSRTINGATFGLNHPAVPATPGGDRDNSTSIYIDLVDRQASNYNLRRDGGLVVTPRFGLVALTAGTDLTPELLSDFDRKGRMEDVWAECSWGINSVTELAAANNAAFADIPGGMIVQNITPGT